MASSVILGWLCVRTNEVVVGHNKILRVREPYLETFQHYDNDGKPTAPPHCFAVVTIHDGEFRTVPYRQES